MPSNETYSGDVSDGEATDGEEVSPRAKSSTHDAVPDPGEPGSESSLPRKSKAKSEKGVADLKTGGGKAGVETKAPENYVADRLGAEFVNPQKSNQIAHALQACLRAPSRPVGVCADQSTAAGVLRALESAAKVNSEHKGEVRINVRSEGVGDHGPACDAKAPITSIDEGNESEASKSLSTPAVVNIGGGHNANEIELVEKKRPDAASSRARGGSGGSAGEAPAGEAADDDDADAGGYESEELEEASYLDRTPGIERSPSLLDKVVKISPYCAVTYGDERHSTFAVRGGGKDCKFTEEDRNFLSFNIDLLTHRGTVPLQRQPTLLRMAQSDSEFHNATTAAAEMASPANRTNSAPSTGVGVANSAPKVTRTLTLPTGHKYSTKGTELTAKRRNSRSRSQMRETRGAARTNIGSPQRPATMGRDLPASSEHMRGSGSPPLTPHGNTLMTIPSERFIQKSQSLPVFDSADEFLNESKGSYDADGGRGNDVELTAGRSEEPQLAFPDIAGVTAADLKNNEKDELVAGSPRSDAETPRAEEASGKKADAGASHAKSATDTSSKKAAAAAAAAAAEGTALHKKLKGVVERDEAEEDHEDDDDAPEKAAPLPQGADLIKLLQHVVVVEIYDERINPLRPDRFIGAGALDFTENLRPENAGVVLEYSCRLTFEDSFAGRVRMNVVFEPDEEHQALFNDPASKAADSADGHGGHIRGRLTCIIREVVRLRGFHMKLNPNSDRKTLWLASFFVLSYLGIGVLFYVLTEEWTVIEALYFSVVTLTTVGYGDFTPTSSRTKLFTCFYIILGISMIAAAIGIVGSYILDKQELAIVDSLYQEKRKERRRRRREHLRMQYKLKKERILARRRKQREAKQAKRGGGRPLATTAKPRADSMSRASLAMASTMSHSLHSDSTNHESKSHAKSGAFSVWEKSHWKNLMSMLLVLLFLAAGVLFFHFQGELDIVDAIYLSIVSLTTVGYGDISPATDAQRLFAIFWILMGTLVTAKAIGDVLDHYFAMKQQKAAQRILVSSLRSVDDLLDFDKNNDGQVDRFEFLSLMLVRINLVSQRDIDEVMGQFNLLDADGDGKISVDELRASFQPE